MSIRIWVMGLATWLCMAGFCGGAELFSAYLADESTNPQSPGWHKLVYHYSADNSDREMPFALYLPQGYDATNPLPMLVFLSGRGERGTDPQMLFSCGVAREMAAHPDIQAWSPLIILMPQCSAEMRWEDTTMAKAAADLTREVASHWKTDTARIYLTGLSMGGSGCWSIAKQIPKQFAVIAPIVGNEFEHANLAAALRGTGTTCLIISGEVDAKSEPGSSVMVQALRQANVDVVYAKVPYGGHAIWAWFYGNKAFYQWLLDHAQGQNPPATRLGAEAFVSMASAVTQQAQQQYQRLNDDLAKVAKWWQVDNCSLSRRPGFRPKLMGKENVFACSPFTADIPCRLQTTTTIPAVKDAKLHLVVGHHPQGSFKLTVRVNEQEIFTTPVDKTKSSRSWLSLDIDLSKYAGQEVRLQLIAANNGEKRDDVYWQTVQIQGN